MAKRKPKVLTMGDFRKMTEKVPDDAVFRLATDDLAQFTRVLFQAQPGFMEGKDPMPLMLNKSESANANAVILFDTPPGTG